MTGGQHGKVVGVDEGSLRTEGAAMVPILARRIPVSQRLVAVRTIGELDGLVRGITDGQLARVGIIDYDRIAAAT